MSRVQRLHQEQKVELSDAAADLAAAVATKAIDVIDGFPLCSDQEKAAIATVTLIQIGNESARRWMGGDGNGAGNEPEAA